MKKVIYSALVLAMIAITACGNNSEENTSEANAKKVEAKEGKAATLAPASERITIYNKGVGSVKNVELAELIDQDMVTRGAELFKTNCSACHKIDKRFIGPSPQGIMERRSPEWIMNMILDPQLMVEQDRCAKDLLVEFNGAAMANQNMTEEQAREILEYFRTL